MFTFNCNNWKLLQQEKIVMRGKPHRLNLLIVPPHKFPPSKPLYISKAGK